MLTKLLSTTALLLLSRLECSSDVFARPGGGGSPPFDSWENSAGDIQSAINAAGAGDTVLVAPGVYALAAALSADKNLVIEGAEPGNPPTLDGQETVQCVNNAGGGRLILRNLIFANGKGTNGGGAYLVDAELSDCVFSNNVSTANGGGLYLVGASSLARCEFIGNEAARGGGLYIDNATGLTVADCYIARNTASSFGGGIYATGPSEGTSNLITRTRIAGNESINHRGGGVYCTGSGESYTFDNCSFIGNTAMLSGGGVYLASSGPATIRNSLIQGNEVRTLDAVATNGGGGADISGGKLINCRIEANTAGYSGGGVLMNGRESLSRNCLIAGNKSLGTAYGGGGIRARYASTNIIENCTIADNDSNYFGGGMDIRGSECQDRIINCIVYGNTYKGGTASSRRNLFLSADPPVVFENCCLETELTDFVAGNSTNIIVANPLFAGEGYKIHRLSPCANYGAPLPWMANAVDIDGHPRLSPATGMVDIGCHQSGPDGTLLSIRSLSGSGDARRELPVVNGGEPSATIVKNSSGGRVVELAVEELRDHIELFTGVRLPVVSAESWNRNARGTFIIVGRGKALETAGVDIGELPAEGYRILTLPRQRIVILAGRDSGNPFIARTVSRISQEFGSLYAVYELLEHWGVRWLFPGELGTVIPSGSDLSVPYIDTTNSPDFRMRNHWLRAYTPDGASVGRSDLNSEAPELREIARSSILWSLRNRAGNSRDEYRGGHHVPRWWDLWFETHPEYLGLYRGNRGIQGDLRGRSKLCAGNPAVAPAIAELAKTAFRNSPGTPSYSICEQDGSPGFCECPLCAALDVYEEGESIANAPLTDRYVNFWNRVAEQVEPEFPDRSLGVYIYSRYNEPPRRETALHPLLRAIFVANGQVEPASLRRRIADWAALSPHPLALYTHPMHGAWPVQDFTESAFPALALENVAEGIRFCRSMGVAGIVGDAGNFTIGNVASHGLLSYAYARWLWNADLSPAEIVDDFTEHAFGAAAQHMKAFFNAINQRQLSFTRENGKAAWLDYHLKVFTQEFVELCRTHLEEATAAAATDTERSRIDLFRQNLIYTRAELELERKWRSFEKGEANILDLLAAYLECETTYAGLPFETRPLAPLFMSGPAAETVALYTRFPPPRPPLPGNSETLVNWGGLYVTGSRNLDLPPALDAESTRRWPYDFDTPINPAYEYGGAINGTDAGPPFYGALENTDGLNGPSNFQACRINNTQPANELIVWGQNYESARNSIRGLIFFKLPVSTDRKFELRQGDLLSVSYKRVSTGTRNIRMALLDGDQWYLSLFVLGEGEGVFERDDLHTAIWGAWNPGAADLSDAVDFDTPGYALRDIRAAGLYFNLHRTTPGSGPRLYLRGFSARLSSSRQP